MKNICLNFIEIQKKIWKEEVFNKAHLCPPMSHIHDTKNSSSSLRFVCSCLLTLLEKVKTVFVMGPSCVYALCYDEPSNHAPVRCWLLLPLDITMYLIMAGEPPWSGACVDEALFALLSDKFSL